MMNNPDEGLIKIYDSKSFEHFRRAKLIHASLEHLKEAEVIIFGKGVDTECFREVRNILSVWEKSEEECYKNCNIYIEKLKKGDGHELS